MIKKEEIELFKDKYVAVGVPHTLIPGRLFFYFGILRYIDFEEIKLETNNGYKIVPITQIMDIHETRRQYR